MTCRRANLVGACQRKIFAVQHFDLVSRVLPGISIVDNIICADKPLIAAELVGQDAADLLRGFVVPSEQTCPLRGLGTIDDQDAVH